MILERELSLLQAQMCEIYATRAMSIAVSPSCMDFLLDKADNPQEGARQIGRIVDKYIRDALAQGIAGGSLSYQDFILFDAAYDERGESAHVVMKKGRMPEAFAACPPIAPAQLLHSIVPPPMLRQSQINLDVIEQELDSVLFATLGSARKSIAEFFGDFGIGKKKTKRAPKKSAPPDV